MPDTSSRTFTCAASLKHNSWMPEPATMPEAAPEPSIFEQPLNERMRTFLRLDFLYSQAVYHNEKASPWGSRAAVGSLLDMLAILTRLRGGATDKPASIDPDHHRQLVARRARRGPHI